MKEVTLDELVDGRTVMMKIGSPVRVWIRRYLGGAQEWLTPLRYFPTASTLRFGGHDVYVAVTIAEVMFPYVIAWHRDGYRWVKIWLDIRDVCLFDPHD